MAKVSPPIERFDVIAMPSPGDRAVMDHQSEGVAGRPECTPTESPPSVNVVVPVALKVFVATV